MILRNWFDLCIFAGGAIAGVSGLLLALEMRSKMPTGLPAPTAKEDAPHFYNRDDRDL